MSANSASVESEIASMKQIIGAQSVKLMQTRHHFVNYRFRLEQLEAWAGEGKDKKFVRSPTRNKRFSVDDEPATSAATSDAMAMESFKKDFLEAKLKALVEEKVAEAKALAEFAIADAERKMKESLNNAIHAERERGQQQLRSAVEEQHMRCRHLALQSYRAATMTTPTSVRTTDVVPRWEPHCMFCLIDEPMFGSEWCAHVNVCAECSIVWSGDDQCKCLTCQTTCNKFVYFGPNPSP
ncbi:hypothetical protein niasHT_037644 [Heterodera trifolii]|uniref:RING-type domain-containing protein n=1 Tax=Heterodera trifolii TaxID=157864 RepID=A0ABD2IKP3_9BILA